MRRSREIWELSIDAVVALSLTASSILAQGAIRGERRAPRCHHTVHVLFSWGGNTKGAAAPVSREVQDAPGPVTGFETATLTRVKDENDGANDGRNLSECYPPPTIKTGNGRDRWGEFDFGGRGLLRLLNKYLFSMNAMTFDSWNLYWSHRPSLHLDRPSTDTNALPLAIIVHGVDN